MDGISMTILAIFWTCFVAVNAYWIGRTRQLEIMIPEIQELRTEVNKYKALFSLSGGVEL